MELLSDMKTPSTPLPLIELEENLYRISLGTEYDIATQVNKNVGVLGGVKIWEHGIVACRVSHPIVHKKDFFFS